MKYKKIFCKFAFYFIIFNQKQKNCHHCLIVFNFSGKMDEQINILRTLYHLQAKMLLINNLLTLILLSHMVRPLGRTSRLKVIKPTLLFTIIKTLCCGIYEESVWFWILNQITLEIFLVAEKHFFDISVVSLNTSNVTWKAADSVISVLYQ